MVRYNSLFLSRSLESYLMLPKKSTSKKKEEPEERREQTSSCTERGAADSASSESRPHSFCRTWRQTRRASAFAGSVPLRCSRGCSSCGSVLRPSLVTVDLLLGALCESRDSFCADSSAVTSAGCSPVVNNSFMPLYTLH